MTHRFPSHTKNIYTEAGKVSSSCGRIVPVKLSAVAVRADEEEKVVQDVTEKTEL